MSVQKHLLHLGRKGAEMTKSAGLPRAERLRRRTDSPSKHVARITWVLLTLLYDEVLEYASCVDRFGISKREFQRDLLKLREIGKSRGFTISNITSGRVFLHHSSPRIGRLNTKSAEIAGTLARIATALGGPFEREIRSAIGDAPVVERPGFLHLREVLPQNGERVADVFSFLKEAAAGPARVEFFYKPARGARLLRLVEPYHVVARLGRCYLIGYDLARRDWRYFALDAMNGPLRKVGTFTPRMVPERFLAERAVGWINGSGSIDVTIRLSPAIAASVTSRSWQDAQRTVERPDGSADISLTFSDLGEAVRWALSFGSGALITAPVQAVAFARETIDSLARLYAGEIGSDLELMSG
jgi:predicted DNA-binding transcriptional regulator YafY